MTFTDDLDLIWHYTGGTGLLGIVNLDRPHIYATNALCLNDTHELLIALDHQVAMMKASLPSRDDLVGEHTVARLYKRWVIDNLDHVSPPSGVYVTSFCRKGDLLSQWRGYGTGTGYALGVSRTELSEALTDGDRLVDVRYGAPDEDFLKRIQPTAVQVGEKLTFDGDPAAVAALKSPAFAEEAEVRLVAERAGREVHFRSGRHGLIPFLKVDIPLSCIKAIRLGPGLSDGEQVKLLAVERGLPHVEVSVSDAPYRG